MRTVDVGLETKQPLDRKPVMHYCWVVFIITFLTLIIAAGVRSAPGVLIIPFEVTFGWNRSVISGALAISLLLYGVCGPFAAAFMDLYGARRIMSMALLLLSVGIGLSRWMTEAWHMTVLWGIIAGIGSGFISSVLGPIVTNRWFVKRRGLILGMLSSAGAAGQLLFLPLYSKILVLSSWQTVTAFIAISSFVVAVLVGLVMRNDPGDLGLLPYGAVQPVAPENKNSFAVVFTGLKAAVVRKDFWLLTSSFFVCGATTTGLIGTHFIPACVDHGVSEVTAASMLSVAGIFNLLGATAAGWFSDKFDNRWLLFWFYLLRGITLMLLPFQLQAIGFDLFIFIVLYGLDAIATIPPTVRLTTDMFGKLSGVVFGWMMAIHQVGGALAALSGGISHTFFGSYQWAFISGAVLCLLASGVVVFIPRHSDTVQKA